jgi:hypothetical protein
MASTQPWDQAFSCLDALTAQWSKAIPLTVRGAEEFARRPSAPTAHGGISMGHTKDFGGLGGGDEGLVGDVMHVHVAAKDLDTVSVRMY